MADPSPGEQPFWHVVVLEEWAQVEEGGLEPQITATDLQMLLEIFSSAPPLARLTLWMEAGVLRVQSELRQAASMVELGRADGEDRANGFQVAAVRDDCCSAPAIDRAGPRG